MFYDPEAYGILPHRHSYTQTGEQALTSFFIPCTKIPKNRERFLEHRGFVDPDKVKAWQDEIRSKMINSPSALMDHCAEYPYNDTEAFSAGNINNFNKVYITEQLTRIRALKQCPTIETGFLEYLYKNKEHNVQDISGFKWIPNVNSKIKILQHPLWTLSPEKDEKGNIIWAPPENPIDNLYVIGIDGIDIGAQQTSENTKDPSSFGLVVLRRTYGTVGPQIVAIYKDRPSDQRESYKIALKLAQYYNAKINIEATRVGLYQWARDMKLAKYFMRRPRATLNESLRNTNKQVGTPATPVIITHQNELIADFIVDNYEGMWFEELLDELNNYSVENKRKFDLVVAMGMAMLANEELQGLVPRIVEKVEDSWEDIGYYTDGEGRRRYGTIPKKNNQILVNNNFGQLYDDNRIRTSNTRLLHGYLW